MARTKMEETIEPISMEELDNATPIRENNKLEDNAVISCLRNERVVVRYIPKLRGIWGNNPKHILSGGMAEGAVRTFGVPKLQSGVYVNVLTKNEKAFLEKMLGLEYDALSVYKKTDNFWDDANPNGVNTVRLHKQDNYFNLADPEDYIRYKILLANKDTIAPSLEALENAPKASYQFVIVVEGEETKLAKQNMSATMRCYKEYGKVEDNIDVLRLLVETIDGRPLANNTKIEFLQSRVNELILLDSKLFLRVIGDPYLNTKVLIKKAINAGIITSRSGLLFLREDNSPLCENGEDSTLTNAAKYLNSPKHQLVMLSIQAKLK